MEEKEKEKVQEKEIEKEDNKEELTIDLNKRNKLRKLKKEIAESKITSGEYEERIREHYNNMSNIKNNDLYKWAEDEDNGEDTTNEIDSSKLNKEGEGDQLENLLMTNKSMSSGN